MLTVAATCEQGRAAHHRFVAAAHSLRRYDVQRRALFSRLCLRAQRHCPSVRVPDYVAQLVQGDLPLSTMRILQ